MVGRNMSLKNPVTPPGIDPGIIRLVAQRLNHYTTPGPFHRRRTILNSMPTFYNTYPVPGLSVQLFILHQQNMLWCQCFWSLLPSAGNKFIFFQDLSDWMYELFTESKAQLCKKAHTVGGYQTEDQWYISVLLKYLNVISLAHLFKSLTVKCYMDSPIIHSADKISWLHGK